MRPRRAERGIDALLPAEIAEKAEAVGAEKTRLDAVTLAVLAVLAGAFIALGALFATTVLAGTHGAVPYGISHFLAGLAFSLGLILVVVGGAELFTGNTLMVMAWAGGKVGLAEMLRAWAIIYVGNLVGAVATALLAILAGQYLLADGDIGARALAIAETKATLPFGRALFLGVLCNVLVCLAVWLALGARSTSDKILAILLPVAAFVAAGFEHSVANMYFIPFGLFIRLWAPSSFWTSIGATPADYADITWFGLVANLVPVTIGNIVGGGVLVGAVYWFVYLRKRGG
ncbi:MAG: formate/nitrite family transporter [Dongiaceae bacterium]